MWAKDEHQQRIDFVNTLNNEITAGIKDNGKSDS